MQIIIESAIKLDKDQQAEVEKILSKKFSGAQLSYSVNKEILGGLRVTMGGKRIDLSLSGKLHQLERVLT